MRYEGPTRSTPSPLCCLSPTSPPAPSEPGPHSLLPCWPWGQVPPPPQHRGEGPSCGPTPFCGGVRAPLGTSHPWSHSRRKLYIIIKLTRKTRLLVCVGLLWGWAGGSWGPVQGLKPSWIQHQGKQDQGSGTRGTRSSSASWQHLPPSPFYHRAPCTG